MGNARLFAEIWMCDEENEFRCALHWHCMLVTRAGRQRLSVHCFRLLSFPRQKKWSFTDTLTHPESRTCEYFFYTALSLTASYPCHHMLCFPLHSNDVSWPFTPPPLFKTLPPFSPESSKAALVSVQGKAWRLVSFELSYVNACSHICLAVLDISTRKWNESVTNVLASVELFSEVRLANSSSVFAFPETPWDGDSLGFRMEGEQFLPLIEKRKKEGKKDRKKEMSCRVAKVLG